MYKFVIADFRDTVIPHSSALLKLVVYYIRSEPCKVSVLSVPWEAGSPHPVHGKDIIPTPVSGLHLSQDFLLKGFGPKAPSVFTGFL